MLTEEAHHMFVGETGVGRTIERTCEAMKEAGISGLKGHRSVGGFRASMYNAMDTDSVKALVEVMQALATKQG